MKVKTLSLLAGASSLLIAGAANAAIVTWNFEVSHFGVDFLEQNGLQSVNVSVTFNEDARAIGLFGSAGHPWIVSTSDASGFHNYSHGFIWPGGNVTVLTEDALDGVSQFDPDNLGAAQWDTGVGIQAHGLFTTLIAPDNNNPFSFARGDMGTNSTSNALTWANLAGDPPSGVLIEAGTTLHIMTLTFGALETADLSWAFFINPFDGQDPDGSEFFVSQHIPAIPAPGALALLGVAGLAGIRRRRA